MEIKLLDKSNAQIIIDREIYSSEVIHKCFYWYGGNYTVDIKTMDTFFVVDISEISKEESIEKIFGKIKKDLIDFKTREIVSIETKNIRDLLVAKAFSNGEFDESLFGDISDPVGFNPEEFK